MESRLNGNKHTHTITRTQTHSLTHSLEFTDKHTHTQSTNAKLFDGARIFATQTEKYISACEA